MLETHLSEKALEPYYIPKASSFTKSVVFHVTCAYTEYYSKKENKASEWRPWDKITSQLFLGKIPKIGLFNNSEKPVVDEIIESIQSQTKSELGLVISTVEFNELASVGVIRPKEWNKRGIKQFILPISDFTANIDNACILAAISLMKQCIDKGESVYVHCKAGRSRSAMLCTIFLMLYGDDENLKAGQSLQVVEDYIREKRPQVELMPEQREKAVEIVRLFKKINMSNEHASPPINIPTSKQEITEFGGKSNSLEKDFVSIPTPVSMLTKRKQYLKNCNLPAEETIEDFSMSSEDETELKPEKQEIEKIVCDDPKQLADYLCSLEFKNAFIHFSAHKELACNSCATTYSYSAGFFKNPNQESPATLLNEFLKGIHDAKNHDWLIRALTNPEMKKILNDEGFVQELKNHLLTLNYDKAMVKKLIEQPDQFMEKTSEIKQSITIIDHYI